MAQGRTGVHLQAHAPDTRDIWLEDQGGEPRLADIRHRFGDRVADIVRSCARWGTATLSLAAREQRKPILWPGALPISALSKKFEDLNDAPANEHREPNCGERRASTVSCLSSA